MLSRNVQKDVMLENNGVGYWRVYLQQHEIKWYHEVISLGLYEWVTCESNQHIQEFKICWIDKSADSCFHKIYSVIEFN